MKVGASRFKVPRQGAIADKRTYNRNGDTSAKEQAQRLDNVEGLQHLNWGPYIVLGFEGAVTNLGRSWNKQIEN